MHTGDWKIDENPVDGDQFDRTIFEKIGEPPPVPSLSQVWLHQNLLPLSFVYESEVNSKPEKLWVLVVDSQVPSESERASIFQSFHCT